MTDFINSFISDLLNQVNDLSFGDLIQWWISYLIGCWVLTGMADGFAAKKRFDMQAEEAAKLEVSIPCIQHCLLDGFRSRQWQSLCCTGH
ncbi:hypothetical protein KSS82_11585 [Vibrio mimicus]|nr:hypothetical protein [Vibrio mimicus]QXC58678.1 hypothetical protein KSS82_11585 [Vibrio mimicus]